MAESQYRIVYYLDVRTGARTPIGALYTCTKGVGGMRVHYDPSAEALGSEAAAKLVRSLLEDGFLDAANDFKKLPTVFGPSFVLGQPFPMPTVRFPDRWISFHVFNS